MVNGWLHCSPSTTILVLARRTVSWKRMTRLEVSDSRSRSIAAWTTPLKGKEGATTSSVTTRGSSPSSHIQGEASS